MGKPLSLFFMKGESYERDCIGKTGARVSRLGSGYGVIARNVSDSICSLCRERISTCGRIQKATRSLEEIRGEGKRSRTDKSESRRGKKKSGRPTYQREHQNNQEE